ncbi:sialin-like isoform X3 [Eriocheir sinensis]|uniref:sialin-like isoform X2 n=1 Tax=Eriocheir sinensis TaxID=95602 RepID=UPI0021C65996|nr:sialin-like isoform X2 [Eriocheir sinensis]XP_050723272.1 sialin-like isoform X3 [Eriocheir sinensis]
MAGDSLCHHGSVMLALEGRDLGRVNAGMVLGESVESANTAVTDHAPPPVPLQSSVRTRDNGGTWWKARNSIVLLSFLGLALTYMVRVCLSIAIVSMVTRNETANASQLSDTCPEPSNGPSDAVVVGEFDWSDGTVSLMLGAFFYGYTATNFVGGRAAEYFGARLTFGLGVVVPSVLSLLSPLCINISEHLFIALRVLEGMTQGVVFPSVHLLIAAWIPPKDKAKHASMILSGVQVGTVIGMSFGGWLCNTTFLGGWPAVFYVFGSLGVLWGIPWFLLAHNLPEHHPRISPSELEYIQTNRHYVKRDKAVAIPWKDIATSKPFWAIMAASFCYNFSFYTLLTELPTFFHNILHFDMNKNAVGSSLPYILQGLTCVGWGFFADLLLRKRLLTVNGIRKLSTSIALYSSAACLVAMMWVDCNAVVAVVVMCLAVGFMGPINSGSSLAEQDIAPNLAGSLKGLTNTLGSATGFLAPAITGAIVNNNQTVSAWSTVFLISATFNLVFCTVFLIFGTDRVQEWNNPKPGKVRKQGSFISGSVGILTTHSTNHNA